MKAAFGDRALNVRKDTLDFRDLMYIPTLVEVPAYRTLEDYRRAKVPVLDLNDIEAIVEVAQKLGVARPATRAVGHQPGPMTAVILDLDLHRARSPGLVHVDRVADHIGCILMSLEEQSGQLEPAFGAGGDETLHAWRDQTLPQNPAPFAHRAIIGKITRSGRYRSGQTGLTVDQLA